MSSLLLCKFSSEFFPWLFDPSSSVPSSDEPFSGEPFSISFDSRSRLLSPPEPSSISFDSPLALLSFGEFGVPAVNPN